MKNTAVQSNAVTCDLCHRRFQVSKETLKDKWVTLCMEKGSIKINHEVLMTFLCCPLCGKRYVVIVDDCDTLPILQELKEVMARKLKFSSKKKPIPQKLTEKYNRLNRKLDFKRQRLAKKFDGALYQSEGDTIQLDYRYHTR